MNKIVIIGAGSASFSVPMINDLSLTPELSDSHVVLVDIDEKRLATAGNLAGRLVAERNSPLTFSTELDREKALEGADFVLNAAQIGGHSYAEANRQLGTDHGYYRGNWLHYMRQMCFFWELAGDIERICPDAWTIQSANPVFEGGTLIARTRKVKHIALCHGHYGYKYLCTALGYDPEECEAHAVGFNHWIWLSALRHGETDLLPIMDAKIRSGELKLSPAVREQYLHYGMMPIGDTPRMCAWWMHIDFETKQKWFGEDGGMDSHVGWAKYLNRLAENNAKLDALASDPKARVSDEFKPTRSAEQIVPIINSLVNNVKGTYQVNIPNEGHIIKGIPEDVCVECQANIDILGVHPISEPPFGKDIMIKAILPRWTYMELMVEAVRLHDRTLLLEYMLRDPRTASYDQAKNFIDAWLSMPGNEYMRDWFGK